MGTDRDWERWGVTDPYFAVCSDYKYRAGVITPAMKTKFFASGEQHVANVLRIIDCSAGGAFPIGSALDFGCGVGRLVIPLAHRATRVMGVDVSALMIAEASHNCIDAGISNVTFVVSDDSLSHVHEMFDLVHSHIVLQHIPWSRGRGILMKLADHVAPGGVLAVQILSRCVVSPIVRGIVRVRYVFPPANWIRNMWRHHPVFEPAMQLHVYHLDIVIHDLECRGFICSHIDAPWSGFRTTFLYARRIRHGDA